MTNRPSFAQLEGLVEFLEQNTGIAKGLLRTTQGKFETKRKWANLATSLNSLGRANKNGEGWAKYWAEKKCALKKQCAQLAASMRRTGGGTADNLLTLSALDNRFVAVMGGQELDYLHNIQASPIPSTSHDDAIPASSTRPTIPAPFMPLQSTIPTRPRRRRRSLIQRPSDANMEQFANIEARRVEAELIAAQAFTQLSENIGNIAVALTSIANAISDVASKMPNP